MLTSRAEYRLLLRHDNADIRLRDYGYQVGLINNEKYEKFINKKNNIAKLNEILKNTKLTPKREINDYLESINTPRISDGSITLYDLLKRPEINLKHLKKFLDTNINFDDEVVEQVEINTKYEGYILKAKKEAEKMINLENIKIPKDIEYDKIHNLASEALQKLKEIKPTSIAQASRISGVNPADISILMVYLKKENRI